MSVVDEQLDLWGVDLGARQREMLRIYVETLASYELANVVGTRQVERLWTDHLLDSLSCLLCGSVGRARSLIDVGSGAGLPGIPLHIASNFGRLCLLESTSKKVGFMTHALQELGISRAQVVDARAEEAGREGFCRESFEVATARAVAPLAVISEYCLPFVEVGGVFVAMKGNISSEEIASGKASAKKLGGDLEEILRVPLVEAVEQKERRLVVVRKLRETPGAYPRKVGMPKKEPLGAGD